MGWVAGGLGVGVDLWKPRSEGIRDTHSRQFRITPREGQYLGDTEEGGVGVTPHLGAASESTTIGPCCSVRGGRQAHASAP